MKSEMSGVEEQVPMVAPVGTQALDPADAKEMFTMLKPSNATNA